MLPQLERDSFRLLIKEPCGVTFQLRQNSCMQLGYALHYGTGVEVDKKRAAALFEQACRMAGLEPDCASRTME
ncbi:MAG: hypothetical protein A2289_20520 [Deltaproteobacteria bacterium RIFOXYA12_FULL_58_15]|nr:MAG: hypothetical protein A2289_20520 [Deltaproteobacteria bacterium RIFOXYA12_FULL_58_15]OGR14068.1 MAG: hypothetical protein A2341_19225 [Deltaproteobacteria bacterium RIFOXYB12_FULL_58_9]